MVYLLLALLLILDFTLFCFVDAQDGSPLQVLASKKTYGPDGPWNAVSVQLGDPAQDIDLYPGGSFASVIFTDGVCEDRAVEPCGSGGLYYPEDSDTIDNTSIALPVTSEGIEGYWTIGALAIDFSDAQYIREDLQLAPTANGGGDTTYIYNLSIIEYSNVSIYYPDGSAYPPQVGQLSLGAPNVNQTFSLGSSTPAVNASLIPGYLNEHKIVPSPSFGLHYGSAALNLPLSLWFGGYDAKRISGEVSTFSYSNNPSNNFNTDLFDIGIAVDNGGSPFSYPSKDKLLSAGNSSIGNSIPINMNPSAPYLSLPNSTCAAIAAELPVTYSHKFGLYFWNTNDPQFTKIVTSPTYLSFTFDNDFMIKVPFKLLNLTLEAPLTETPTQYFPCQPPQSPTATDYSLGRAFLQAAFIGADWTSNNGQWFLAQAPGPDVGTVPQQLSITSPSIPATPDSWANSWKSSWTPLPVTASSPESPAKQTASSGGGLSAGADAGIAIGAAAAVLTGLIVGFLLYRRRKRQTPSLSALLPGHKDDEANHPQDIKEGMPPPQYATTNEPQEMDVTPAPASELAGAHRSEMGDGAERYEMYQPSRRGTGDLEGTR